MRRAGLALILATAALAWPGVGALAAAGPTVIATSEPDDVFRPANVTIAVGQTVHWHNHDGKHNVRFNASGKRIGGDPIAHTATDTRWDAQFTFNKAGTFRYYCEEHSDGQFGMVGKVVVKSPDHKAPVISSLRTEPTKFCTNKSQNCTKRGTKIKFTLSEAAKVTADVKRDKPNASRKQIFANRQLKAGARSIDYAGKDLAPGVYVLRLRAKDAAGNAAQPKTTKFTVKAKG
jgi:plastocyanin